MLFILLTSLKVNGFSCFYLLDVNQEKIVNEGGLDALLMLLRTSQNSTILRVASGAIANLAMNGMQKYLSLFYI